MNHSPINPPAPTPRPEREDPAAPSAIARADPKALPGPRIYRVDITPAAVLERLAADEAVAMVKRLPARSPSGPRFLALSEAGGFRVVQNIPRTGAFDAGPPQVRRFSLDASVRATGEGAEVHVDFRPGPPLRQLSYWVLWGTSVAWILATGVTGAKIGLVVALFIATAPVFVYDRRQARGAREDRLELLSLMERILGPARIGESRTERTPYRDGHPAPRADPSADEDDEDDE